MLVAGAIFGFKELKTLSPSVGADCFLCLGVGDDVLEDCDEEEEEECWEGMKQTGELCDLLKVWS